MERAFEHLVQGEPLAPSRPARSGRGGDRQRTPDPAVTTLDELAKRVDRLAEAVDGWTKRADGHPTVAAVGELGQRMDRLTERVSALSEGAGEGGAARAASDEVMNALSALRAQLQADVAKVTQRVASETSVLRNDLHTALAAGGNAVVDPEARRAAIAATSENVRALLAEERRAFRAHIDATLAEQAERVHATLADERRALRSELQAVLARLTDQAAEERKERRSELHNAMANSTERLRSVLVDERKELRGELQVVLPDVLRHRAEEWQQLRSALDASVSQNGENVLLAVTQLGQQIVDLRRELTATMVKANDRWAEERDLLFSELQAALATTAQRLADDQHRAGTALEAALAESRNERLAFEVAVSESLERTGEVVAALSGQLDELRRDVAVALGQLGAQHTDELAHVRADLRTGLVNSHNQLVTQQHELHRALEAKLTSERQARYRDGIKHAADLRAVVDEVRNALAEDRRELRLLVAAAIEGANQWFAQLRDQLHERLETVIDVTAQSSASAASAVKALRRDLAAAEGDPRLLEALARLSEDIDRLERKIPARIALRLPDSQLAAIADAVRGPGVATPTRGRAAGRKGATATKKAAPPVVRGGAGADRPGSGTAPAAGRRRAPPTDPAVRSW